MTDGNLKQDSHSLKDTVDCGKALFRAEGGVRGSMQRLSLQAAGAA